MTRQASAAFGVAILAAGRSTRMGRPKMLLPWGDSSVLGHLVTQWKILAATQIAVVCAIDDAAIQSALDRLRFSPGNRILNPSPDSGMFSSIQCAARWPGWDRQALTHLAIVLGDQPHLREETLRLLLAFCDSNPSAICLLRHDGHRRHPVLIPMNLVELLADWPPTNLRTFLDAMTAQTAILESDDAGLALDLDRPEDYERAVREFQRT
jgi:molybdenum cofactor cytidylyltransferase